MEQIKYRKGYKYQLAEDYTIYTNLVGYQANTEFIKLTLTGILTIKQGYAWDGPSGPTIDTPDFMRGSIVHDALYQLLRQGLLPQEERRFVDKLLQDICLEDGMSKIRAHYVFEGVNMFGGSSANPKSKKEIITAPWD